MKYLALAVLFLYPIALPSEPINLDAWYSGYDSKYFNNELPKNVVTDRHLRDERFMALTIYDESYFHITFNLDYIKENRGLRLTLLHEMCHLSLVNDPEYAEHGPKWQACMHELANKGAMEDLW